MAFADASTMMNGGGDGSIIGKFYERDFGYLFEFSENNDDLPAPWDKGTWPHKIWVMEEGKRCGGDRGYRYGKVLKTRAYIVTDEDENGPVVEKWYFNHQNRVIYPRHGLGVMGSG